jgi:hypothetical protein
LENHKERSPVPDKKQEAWRKIYFTKNYNPKNEKNDEIFLPVFYGIVSK